MKIAFDPAKSARNAQERQLPFDLVQGFIWDTATIEPDVRKDYPEPRFVATGYIGERLHVVCFTPVAVGAIRIISFRKANKREIRDYVTRTPH
jgi:uncharacterized DUF497 family protein